MARHPVDHPLRKAARRFGTALDKAIQVSGLSRQEVANQSGQAYDSISAWSGGWVMPTIASAAALASVLEEPGLVDIARQARTRPCAVCATDVVSERMTGAPRIYCGDICRRVGFERDRGDSKQRASNAQRIADAAVVALKNHREAVASFCRGCEPEGRCRNARCQLRPISPLPLIGGVA